MDNTLDWKSALDHYFEMLRRYIDLLDIPQANPHVALQLTYFPILRRYLGGERSQELFDDMMATA